MTTVQHIKNNLTGMSGGASVDDIVNLYELMERAANTMLARTDPVSTIRLQALSQFVHDDLQNYSLPSDYKKLIDIANSEDRSSTDRAGRIPIETFAAGIDTQNKQISVEGLDGVKYIRINWKDDTSVSFHDMDSLTAEGTIAVVGTASGLKANTQFKLSGSASIEFDAPATGDGIQCTGMTAVDLSDEEEYADVIIPVYISSAANLANITSFTFIIGNDLTANYWTFTSQTTQSDGTAFRVGWNMLLFPWSTATETGSVTNTAFDAWKLTVATTGAVTNLRADNILVSLGRPFDLKYYSQYVFKNTAGTWISLPTGDDDSCVLSGTELQIYLLECQSAIYQQMKTVPKNYQYSKEELNSAIDGLYRRYRGEYPSQSKSLVDSYWGSPRYGR